MSKKCCVPNCRLQKDDPGCLKLSFFKIPTDEKLRNEWLNNINQNFEKEIAFKRCSYVCAFHFEPTCFNFGGLCKIVRLKKGSCPTIFENYSSKDPVDYVNDNQKDVYTEADEVLSESINLQKICNGSTVVDHTYAVANTNAKPHDSGLENDNHIGPSNNSVDSEAVLQVIKLEDNDNYKTNTFDDLADTIEGSQINEVSQSSTNYSKIAAEENLRNKSLANINLDSIDYGNKAMVRRILEKAKKEVIYLRRYRRVQAMRLYRTRKKVKNSASLINHVKQRHLITDKVAEILKDTVSVEAGDLFKHILQQHKVRGSFPPSLRSFATKLHFYSPKAYEYIRKTFVKCLPHPVTISKWYRNGELTEQV